MHPRDFKKCLIRSLNNQKYTDYYIFLEECINYYNEYQVLKLKRKLNEANKKKLVELENSDTLDDFIILKSNKYKNSPYATIKESQKNVDVTLNDLDLTM